MRTQYLQSGVPLVTTLKEYRLAWLSKDSIAGLSACIVSIPSVIAYAELVHLPAIAGLVRGAGGGHRLRAVFQFTARHRRTGCGHRPARRFGDPAAVGW
jgi:hypothetical protein